MLNPLLLSFTALGGIPILIHLLNKRRFRPVQWAAMEFLLKAMKQNSRRLQVRDLILMLIRTLAVVFLCLALARPTIGSQMNFLGASSKTGAVILIDNSFSMGYNNGRESRFDVAKRLVKTILAQLPKGAWCAVYSFNTEVRAPLGDPSQNLAYIEQELDRYVLLSDGTTNVEKSLQQVEKLFRTHREFQAANKEVYIITDMQARPWQKKQVSSSFSGLLSDISNNASVYLVDVGDAGGENAAITDLIPSDTLVTVEAPVRFTVNIKNNGQAELFGLSVDLYIDNITDNDRPVERQTVDLEPGGVSSVSFETSFNTGGDHKVMVKLADDRLMSDNRRYLTVEVVEETHVLLVDGKDQRNDDPLSSEAGYLKYALSPIDVENPEDKAVVVTELVPHYRLGEKNLGNYQAMALCNIERMNRSAIDVIKRQVFSGMGLMIFLGDQTDPLYYNQTFGPTGADLLPGEILEAWGTTPKVGEKLPTAKSLANDVAKISHPIMTAFNEEEARPLLAEPKFYRAYGLKPMEGDDIQVVMSLDDGTPLAIERKIGSGSVILFGTPATTAWSNWPTKYAFPITLLRTAGRLTLGNRPSKNVAVSTPIRGYLSLADQKTKVNIQPPPPAKKTETQPESTGDGRAVFDFADTDRGGFYEVSLERAGYKPLVYSLNANAGEEADLTPIQPESIRRDYPDFNFLYVSKSEDLRNKLINEKHGTEVWPWFIGLVFAMLALETALTYFWAPRD